MITFIKSSHTHVKQVEKLNNEDYNKLPSDNKINIASFLSFKDLKNLEKVNSEWNKITKDPSLQLSDIKKITLSLLDLTKTINRPKITQAPGTLIEYRFATATMKLAEKKKDNKKDTVMLEFSDVISKRKMDITPIGDILIKSGDYKDVSGLFQFLSKTLVPTTITVTPSSEAKPLYKKFARVPELAKEALEGLLSK